MPCQFFYACTVVVIYIFLVLVFIVGQHDTLHKFVSVFYVAQLFLYVCAYIAKETVFSVYAQLLFQVVCNLVAESLLVFYNTLAESLVKELLIDGVFLIASNLCYLV